VNPSSSRPLQFFQSLRRGNPLKAGASSASERTGQVRPLRIAIFGLFGYGNLGNDGSLESILAFLRAARPSAELCSICHGPDVVSERFQLSAAPISAAMPENALFRRGDRLLLGAPKRLGDLVSAIRLARQFDVIIVPGTGILDDFGDRWTGMAYHLFRWGLAARIAGTPFAFVSIGAGPILHPMSRWLMKNAARMARYRSYRDNFSKAYMAGIGLDRPGDLVTPDLAFRLPLPEPSPTPHPERPVIGVGVMGYGGWKHGQADGEAIYRGYVDKISEFSAWLLSCGFGVRLLVGDDGDAQAISDVSERIATLRAGVSGDYVVAEPADSLTDIMRQIGETELVVATRFHNVVCALMMTKPTISIGYAKKNEVLLAAAGLGAFSQHIETLDLEKLKRQFDRLMAEREAFIPQIAATAASYRDQLAKQETRLLAELL
jgi:polysaccharide pyruvyl transferase WcaK-like protein